MRRRGIIVVAVGAVMALGIVGMAGCDSPRRIGADIAQAEREADRAEGVAETLRTEIEGLKSDLAALGERDPETGELVVADEQTAKVAADLLALIESKTDEANEWLDRFAAAEAAAEEARAKAERAEDAWDWAEVFVGLAAGIFPPAAVAIPIVQRSRRAFEGVVASVAAGGGPADAEATRKAMAAVPGLKDRVTKVRVKMGDKQWRAVRRDT
jgi:hypothetical protein